MSSVFSDFFYLERYKHLERLINLALDEDGPDIGTTAIFASVDRIQAIITAKEDIIVAGLPVIPLILNLCIAKDKLTEAKYNFKALFAEGEAAPAGASIAYINGQTRLILRAERIILNIISRLCGIAGLTRQYVTELEGSGICLLDTRKTMPGMRGLDKYAVRIGGGKNHRFSLADMIMLKDNHIDAAGSVTEAVRRVRKACPEIFLEIECRNIDELEEALSTNPNRIMLDNMKKDTLCLALKRIPDNIEVEISGNVTLNNIKDLALTGKGRVNFISVGSITHSARSVDLSIHLVSEV